MRWKSSVTLPQRKLHLCEQNAADCMMHFENAKIQSHHFGQLQARTLRQLQNRVSAPRLKQRSNAAMNARGAYKNEKFS